MTARKTAPKAAKPASEVKKPPVKVPETTDNATGKLVPLYRAKLGTLLDVRRELAKVYRRMMAGSIEP